jgi:hypothetical protein
MEKFTLYYIPLLPKPTTPTIGKIAKWAYRRIFACHGKHFVIGNSAISATDFRTFGWQQKIVAQIAPEITRQPI